MATVPVGLSRDLAPGRVMRGDVQGTDVAIWRDLQGTVHAWNNRCPHRGMRLSHGFVRGDRLACLYHGWQFAKSGVCARIPAHPELEPPETICAQVFSAEEASGVIWVNVTEAAVAPDVGTGFDPLRSLSFACDETQVLQSLQQTQFGGSLPKVTGEAALLIDELEVRVFCNQTSPTKTVVHFLVSAGTATQQLKALSRWCETARGSVDQSQRKAA